jgi:hypothetical protein
MHAVCVCMHMHASCMHLCNHKRDRTVLCCAVLKKDDKRDEKEDEKRQRYGTCFAAVVCFEIGHAYSGSLVCADQTFEYRVWFCRLSPSLERGEMVRCR